MIRLKDIAKSLGLSTATVSRALQDHPSIKQSTKALVQAKAKELDFVPNPVAFNLKKRKSGVIGVVVPDLAHFYFSGILSGMEEVALGNKRNILICQSKEAPDKEKEAIRILRSYHVEGILLSVTSKTNDVSYIIDTIQAGTPVALFDRIPLVLFDQSEALSDLNCITTTLNDFEIAKSATHNLLATGVRTLAVLAAPQELNIGKNRLDGIRSACQEAGLAADSIEIETCVPDAVTYQKYIEYWLKRDKRPEGFVFCTGQATMIFLGMINKMGLRLGRDLQAAGFLSDLFTGFSVPGLIRVRAPLQEIGKHAMSSLLQHIDAKSKQPLKHQVVSASIEWV